MTDHDISTAAHIARIAVGLTFVWTTYYRVRYMEAAQMKVMSQKILALARSDGHPADLVAAVLDIQPPEGTDFTPPGETEDEPVVDLPTEPEESKDA